MEIHFKSNFPTQNKVEHRNLFSVAGVIHGSVWPNCFLPQLLTILPVLGERGPKEGVNVIHHLFRIDEQTRDMKFCTMRRGKEKAYTESQEREKHLNNCSCVSRLFPTF